jgi:hypothetical protein
MTNHLPEPPSPYGLGLGVIGAILLLPALCPLFFTRLIFNIQDLQDWLIIWIAGIILGAAVAVFITLKRAALSELRAQESYVRPDKTRVCRHDFLIRQYEPCLVTTPYLGLIV